MNSLKKSLFYLLFFNFFFLYTGCAQQNTQSNSSSYAGGGYVDLTQAAAKTINAVVHINAEMMQKHSMWDNFFQDPFFSFFNIQPQQQLYQAYGSGVIIDKDGYIVTNNHVVEGAIKITVTFNDKRKYEATLVGADPLCDLALLKINASDLEAIQYGNSDNIQIGEWVLAVGNPYNLNSTVTAGIISAKTRNLNILGGNTSVESFIQTDAAVNSG
ncbi:MAG TPA: trypsin-like peptidase domain-containing protein, partial [Bacteroidales bacterium]|nr:trypsin-like peptidase domain-containing protein [Bacteroidales bacterium]